MHGLRTGTRPELAKPCHLIRAAAWVFPDYGVAGATEAFVDDLVAGFVEGCGLKRAELQLF
jgi:hypothetical protein